MSGNIKIANQDVVFPLLFISLKVLCVAGSQVLFLRKSKQILFSLLFFQTSSIPFNCLVISYSLVTWVCEDLCTLLIAWSLVFSCYLSLWRFVYPKRKKMNNTNNTEGFLVCRKFSFLNLTMKTTIKYNVHISGRMPKGSICFLFK